MKKEKVAIVVQRNHPEAVGGSEALANQYAHLLKNKFEIHVITTCAIDAVEWRSVLTPGIEKHDGIAILRFKNQEGHTDYWKKLHNLLNSDFKNIPSPPQLQIQKKRNHKFIDWPRSLQEEWVRTQGPHSPELLFYLHKNHNMYKYFIFLTYLYSPTCFGLFLVPKKKSFLVPTLHNEPAAHLPIFHDLAKSAKKLFWNTNTEKKLGDALWGKLPGRIISMHVKTEFITEGAIEKEPYFLYLGRIEAGKGCLEMLEFYLNALRELQLQEKMILAGKLGMKLQNHKQIQYKGFVSENEKFNLIKYASALIMPSPNESLSIVTLEAMAQKTPVISNKKNPVLLEHVESSGCDFSYRNYETFVESIQKVKTNRDPTLLKKGREYVFANYSKEVVQKRLLEELI